MAGIYFIDTPNVEKPDSIEFYEFKNDFG